MYKLFNLYTTDDVNPGQVMLAARFSSSIFLTSSWRDGDNALTQYPSYKRMKVEYAAMKTSRSRRADVLFSIADDLKVMSAITSKSELSSLVQIWWGFITVRHDQFLGPRWRNAFTFNFISLVSVHNHVLRKSWAKASMYCIQTNNLHIVRINED